MYLNFSRLQAPCTGNLDCAARSGWRIFCSTNQFRIQDITEGRSELIFNPELPAQLKALGWAATDPDTGNLDWQRSVKGEESYHPYHDLRRVWRAMSLAAPSLQLPSRVEGPYTRAYPFAVKAGLSADA